MRSYKTLNSRTLNVLVKNSNTLANVFQTNYLGNTVSVPSGGGIDIGGGNVDLSSYALKTYVDSSLTNYVLLNGVYTKSYIDSSFNGVYTKSYIDSSFNGVYTKSYVDGSLNAISTKLYTLTNGAPEALDTLAEITTAIKSDASFGIVVYQKIASSDLSINNLRTLISSGTQDPSLADVYTKSYIDASFGNVYTKSYIDASFGNVYTTGYIDNSFGNVYTKSYIDNSFGNVYTKSYVDSSFANVYTKSYIDNSFGNVYTKSYVDSSFANYALINSVYTRSYIDNSFGNVYTKSYVDSSFANYALLNGVYTKSYIDNSFGNVYTKSYVDSSFANYALLNGVYTKSYIDNSFGSVIANNTNQDLSFNGNMQLGSGSKRIGINKTAAAGFSLDVSGAATISGNLSVTKNPSDASYSYFDLTSVNINLFNTVEKFTTLTFNISSMTLDYTQGSIFYTTATANFAALVITNVPTTLNRSITVTLITPQTGTFYFTGTAIIVNGTSRTYIKQDGTAFAVPSAARTMIIYQFTIIFASATPTVVGFMTGYS
jgi:hypothetical protein